MDIGFHFSWIKTRVDLPDYGLGTCLTLKKNCQTFPQSDSTILHSLHWVHIARDPCHHLNCQSLFHYNLSGGTVAISLCGFSVISLVNNDV